MRKGISNIFSENKSASYLTQSFFEIVDVIVGAIIFISIIGTFCFNVFVVNGNSMRDTLYNGDKVLATNFLYEPKNGDIVVIRCTKGSNKSIVKRVIATSGQTLKIDFDKNEVYVDGEILDEPYVSLKTIKSDAEIPEVIPDGCIFVMGDNRFFSKDSRNKSLGLVNTSSVVGKVNFILLPLNRFGSPYSSM